MTSVKGWNGMAEAATKRNTRASLKSIFTSSSGPLAATVLYSRMRTCGGRWGVHTVLDASGGRNTKIL